MFDLAKEILSRAPVLSNLDWSKEFFVETDASQFRVGESSGSKTHKTLATSLFHIFY